MYDFACLQVNWHIVSFFNVWIRSISGRLRRGFHQRMKKSTCSELPLQYYDTIPEYHLSYSTLKNQFRHQD